MTTGVDGMLDLGYSQRELDIAVIHAATGWYTVPPEISALLGRLGWPGREERMLDPGAGDGGFLVAALAGLELTRDDVAYAAGRVRGYEFDGGAAAAARFAVRGHLTGRGWTPAAAGAAAGLIVEQRDFLLDPPPPGTFDLVAANPPYLRYGKIPAGYRADYDPAVPVHARADMLLAYLDAAAAILAPGGRIGLIAADRWLLNVTAGELRRRLGERFTVTGVHRLDAASSFYLPKPRRRNTPARVHPVTLILQPHDGGGAGRRLGAEPFRLTVLPDVDGVPLTALAEIRLAPYLGPDGIFTVDAAVAARIRAAAEADGRTAGLVPAVEPGDITAAGLLRPTRRWVLVTTAGVEPPPEILTHLDSVLHRMPASARRIPRWLPPETFTGKLPVAADTVMVPRIAQTLRAVRLPAGVLPANHQLVVVSGLPVETITAMLLHDDVQAQAAALTRGVDGGYNDYTASLLRDLIIPRHLIPPPGQPGRPRKDQP